MNDAKKFSTSMNLVDGIDLTFSCEEQMDVNYDDDFLHSEKIPNGKYRLGLDLLMCDEDALDGTVEVKLPDGSKLEYSSKNGGWMDLKMKNGLRIYQEISKEEA